MERELPHVTAPLGRLRRFMRSHFPLVLRLRNPASSREEYSTIGTHPLPASFQFILSRCFGRSGARRPFRKRERISNKLNWRETIRTCVELVFRSKRVQDIAFEGSMWRYLFWYCCRRIRLGLVMACKYLWVLVSGYILPVLFCIQVRLVASLTQVLLSLMVLLLVNLLQFAEPDKLLVQREIAAAVMRLRDQDPHQGCSCGVQEPSTMDSRVTPTGARDKDLDSRDRADAINPRAEGDERRKVMKTWWRRIVGGKRGKMEL